MSKFNIDDFSYEDAIKFINNIVDCMIVVDGNADRYRTLVKRGMFTNYIDDSGDYIDLVKKLWYHFNNSSEEITEDYHVFIPNEGRFGGKYSKRVNIIEHDITHVVQMTVYPIVANSTYLFILDELEAVMFVNDELTVQKVNTIQNTYLFSMYIDLVNDSTSSISVTEVSDEVMQQEIKYSEWRNMIINMIWPEDQQLFLERTDPDYLKKNFAPGRTASFDCLMMNLEGKYIWVKLIFSRSETSNEDDYRFVFMVQNIHENSIELLETMKKYEHLASRDSLTNVFNHGRMEAEIRNALYAKQNKNREVSLMIIDIDFFKHVNDKFGHSTGDVTLVQFTNIIADYIKGRPAVLGRWGGEEFVIVCYDTGSYEVYEMAEALRKKVADDNFGKIGQITCSIGVTTLNEDDTFDDAFNRMDRALYNAKSSGRNCVKSV